MTDREFDRLLYEGASQLPPEGPSAVPPQPWRSAMGPVCWGLVLTSVTLNFWNLQYILPAVGSVLLYLGFRSLRRENAWFRLAYWLSALLLAVRFAHTILLATPLAQWLTGTSATLFLGLPTSLVCWLLYFALWRGLRRVFRKAGQEPGTGAAGAVVACYTLIVLLALWNTRIQIQRPLAWLVLLLWLVLLTRLFKVSRCLDEAGYAVAPAPVRLSNQKAALLALLSLAAAVAACLLLFSRYPVHGAPAQAGTGQAELRAELAELGFPEDLLADLTDEEVAQLEGATEVSYGITTQGALTSAFVYQGGLTVTFVQVSLPDRMARYFYFFSWTEPPDTRFMDGIRVAPMWQGLPYFRPSAPQGRLLWEEDGQDLQCPLVSDGPFIAADGPYHYFDVNFSLPRDGERVRGYLTWTMGFGITTNFNADFTYIHQTSLLHYPWSSPCQAYGSDSLAFYELSGWLLLTYTVPKK